MEATTHLTIDDLRAVARENTTRLVCALIVCAVVIAVTVLLTVHAIAAGAPA